MQNSENYFRKKIRGKILSLTNGFLKNFVPQTFDYSNYKEAWYNTFFVKPSSHSKFFNWGENFQNNFPNWFQEWWFFMGASPCETPRKSNFLKNCKMVISVKTRNFSRSRMTKRTTPLESSREIKLPRRISSNFETVGISRFSRHRVSGAVKRLVRDM